VVDSTAVLELTLFLEETFDISIPDEEIVPDNLDSVDRMVAYIERKTA
jgi:acyl carrier protein